MDIFVIWPERNDFFVKIEKKKRASYGNASLRSDAQNHLCMRVKSGPLEVEFRTLVVWLSILAYKGYMTKYGHETCDFFMKNRKKGHPIDFFSP